MLSRKITALSLASMMALLVSCGDAQPIDTGNTDTVSDSTAVETLSAAIPDGLNLNGAKVTFLYRETSSPEFYSETATGDVVNDAIYNSFLYVESLLNTDIEVVTRPGDVVGDREEYCGHIRSTVMSGDSSYDWVDTLIGLFPGVAVEGLFSDLNENQYINFDAPYWIAGQTESCAPTGKLYFASGDSSLGYLKSAYCLFFNTTLANTIGTEDIYQLVLDGKWTLDKLLEVSASASGDIDGDGEWTLDDRIGFAVHDFTHPRAFLFSTGGQLFGADGDSWTFTYGSERDIDVVEKLNKLFYETDGSYYYNGSNAISDQVEGYNKVTSAFTSGKILFMTAEFDHAVSQLRAMNDNYGIIPCPKYSEEDDYRTVSRSTHNAFALLKTSGNTDAAGAVLEALSAYKYKPVLPAYFEVALKTKYSRDDTTSQMCDIIRDSMVLDFGFVFNNELGNPIVTVFEPSFNNPTSMSSTIASQKQTIETKIEDFLGKLAEVE